MKMNDNGMIRDMTEEEVAHYFGGNESPLTETEQKAAAYDVLMGVSE